MSVIILARYKLRFDDVPRGSFHFRKLCRFIRFNVSQCNPEVALSGSYYSHEIPGPSLRSNLFDVPRGNILIRR